MTGDALPYRPCVGILLLNRDGRIFAGRRIDGIAEAWQMPQGGVDPGEAEDVAAMRELQEETGLHPSDVRMLRAARSEVRYDLPPELLGKIWGGKYRGQTQRWFAMRMTSTDAAIRIDTDEPEFAEWRWMTADTLMQAIVPFKRDVYRDVFAEFSDMIGVAGE